MTSTPLCACVCTVYCVWVGVCACVTLVTPKHIVSCINISADYKIHHKYCITPKDTKVISLRFQYEIHRLYDKLLATATTIQLHIIVELYHSC